MVAVHVRDDLVEDVLTVAGVFCPDRMGSFGTCGTKRENVDSAGARAISPTRSGRKE
jgi:hypothetical protein